MLVMEAWKDVRTEKSKRGLDGSIRNGYMEIKGGRRQIDVEKRRKRNKAREERC